MSAGFQLNTLMLAEIGVLLDGFQHRGEFISQKDGDNGRRGLVPSQTVVVSGAGGGNTHQIRIFVHRFDYGHEKYQKLNVLFRGFAGIQQVFSRVGGDGPVVVLAASVDSLKGLLVEQACQTVFIRHFLHDLHSELIVIHGHVGGVKDGRQLVLGRRHLIMFGLGGNSQFPQLFIQVVHVGSNPGL